MTTLHNIIYNFRGDKPSQYLSHLKKSPTIYRKTLNAIAGSIDYGGESL